MVALLVSRRTNYRHTGTKQCEAHNHAAGKINFLFTGFSAFSARVSLVDKAGGGSI